MKKVLLVTALFLPVAAETQRPPIRVAVSSTSTIDLGELRRAFHKKCSNVVLNRDPSRADYALEAIDKTINLISAQEVLHYRFTLFNRAGSAFYSTSPDKFSNAIDDVCVALVQQSASTRQGEPSLESRIMQALEVKEPDWKPTVVIESGRIPLVSSEKGIVATVWQNPKSHEEDAGVSVYEVANHVDATAWLGPVRNKQVSPGWKVGPYQIGDEGYLSKYEDGRRFDIEFRRGNVVAKITGSELRLVKAFAKCIVDQISVNPNSQ